MNIALLKTLSELPGISGREHRIRTFIEQEIAPLVDEMHTDNLGNLIALKRGTSGKRVAIAAHMDEIGFMIKHIYDEGFAKFHPIGGFDPKTLIAQRVIAHGKQDIIGVIATKPIHIQKPAERTGPQALDLDDLFIDFCMPGDELRQLLAVGDWVSRKQELLEVGHCVNGKSLDNRIAVFILIETLRAFAGCPHDVYAVFSVQEEVGLRGAQVAAHSLNPDFAFAIDGTITYDLPDAAAALQVSRLGKGPAIKYADGSVIADQRLVRYMHAVADQLGIAVQREVLPAGGTDTGALQRYGKNGAIAGCLSVPMRHVHTSVETVHKGDLDASIRLMVGLLQHFDQFSYQW